VTIHYIRKNAGPCVAAGIPGALNLVMLLTIVTFTSFFFLYAPQYQHLPLLITAHLLHCGLNDLPHHQTDPLHDMLICIVNIGQPEWSVNMGIYER
jgi:hypothetical protein